VFWSFGWAIFRRFFEFLCEFFFRGVSDLKNALFVQLTCWENWKKKLSHASGLEVAKGGNAKGKTCLITR